MPWFRVTAAVYRRALPLAGGRAGSLAALRQHARGCASMSWAWVARRVASDGRAQPQGAEKRPSEMCALDRPNRLVIRPHRPPVPKTCKPLYPCIAWELVAPASCSHAAARRCAASCSARGGCSCGTEAESDDAELRRIENAIAARTKATMLLRNWRWRPTPTGELASSTHSKLHWPTRRCSIRGQSRPIVKHSAHIGVIVE